MGKRPAFDPSGGRTVSRREFLRFCGGMTAVLALPARYAERIAVALETAPRPPLAWLEFQDCTGDTESFLRANQPTVDELILETVSLDYHETLMTAAGGASELSLTETIRDHAGEYICIVEGSVPTGAGGAYCTIRGRTALSIADEVCRGARATIAAGSCAWDGGLAAAAPNPTGAVGIGEAVPGLADLVALPGCPANATNITATLVHFLTFGEMPETDDLGRPHFAYGEEIHEECPRHKHYDAEHFVSAWGDEAHRKGWCLYRMGCRGPETHHNCPVELWNDGTSWPVGAGHPCIGCTEPHFWDAHTPFYVELEDDDDED